MTKPNSPQVNWRWCLKCQGLFFVGNPSSVCPKDGAAHDGSQSGMYALRVGSAVDPIDPLGQHTWRWCHKCQGLFFGSNPGSVCPKDNAAHDGTGHEDYTLYQNPSGRGRNIQLNWQWCKKCQGLAFAGGGILGPCPAGGQHDHTGSGNYGLTVVAADPTNRVQNPSFEMVGPLGSFTTDNLLLLPGPGAADQWEGWNNHAGTTTNSILPTTLRTTGSGEQMIHITTDNTNNIISQQFIAIPPPPAPPPGLNNARIAAWVFAVRGVVGLGAGNGGGSSFSDFTTTTGKWELLEAIPSPSPVNTIGIGSANSGFTDFYLDDVVVTAE